MVIGAVRSAGTLCIGEAREAMECVTADNRTGAVQASDLLLAWERPGRDCATFDTSSSRRS